MSKNKNRNSSSSVDSKMETAKNIIRETGEIAAEAGKALIAIGTAYAAYKGIKGNKQQ
ncbi:MAG: hypothetical protein NC111_07465 [Bacteroides sp.]|nr:hypothetical protein [Bacteroides sp.]MCM1472347.1 hypothetical protein [Bacteroides sp.]